MSTPKKPKRIKGRIGWDLVGVKNKHGLTARFISKPAYLFLSIDNPNALVEQVAQAIRDDWNSWSPKDSSSFALAARAALRSIGVPLKGRP